MSPPLVSLTGDQIVSEEHEYYCGNNTIGSWDQTLDLENFASNREECLNPESCTDVIVIRTSQNRVETEENRKIYWKATTRKVGRYLIIFEEDESLGQAGDTSALTSNCPEFLENPEDENFREEGIFTTSYRQKILFSKNVEIHTASLPRWVPQIIIDRLNISLEDD